MSDSVPIKVKLNGKIETWDLYDPHQLHLEHLGIDEIDLTGVEKLPAFSWICLDGNNFKKFDLVHLGMRSDFDSLSLHSNHISSIDLNQLKNCINIDYIGLSDNNLENIDLKSISKTLRVLFLGNNLLKTIEIPQLPNLEHLSLYNNFLSNINLENLNDSILDHLDLSYNNLSSIKIPQLTKIEKLNLSNNFLEHIDITQLIQSSKLETLNFSNNQIQNIDLSLINYKSLESLRISGNKLSSIDLTPLSNAKLLEYLDLSYNNIKQIDLTPLIDTNLAGLNLNDNQLTNILLSDIAKIRSLEEFSLLGNNLHEINLTPLNNCKKLRVLKIGVNNLDLSQLTKCKNLREIHVHIDCDVKNAHLLKLVKIIRLVKVNSSPNVWNNHPNYIDLQVDSMNIDFQQIINSEHDTNRDFQKKNTFNIDEMDKIFWRKDLTYLKNRKILDISNFKNLKSIRIFQFKDIPVSFDFFRELDRLEILHIEVSKINIEELDNISYLLNLKELYLTDAENYNQLWDQLNLEKVTINLSFLKNLQNLEIIDINLPSYCMENFELINDLSNLKKLNLSLVNVERFNVDLIQNNKIIRGLFLINNIKGIEIKENDPQITFSKLKRIKNFINSQGPEAIADNEVLNSHNLSFNKTTEVDIPFLMNLSNITIVNLTVDYLSELEIPNSCIIDIIEINLSKHDVETMELSLYRIDLDD